MKRTILLSAVIVCLAMGAAFGTVYNVPGEFALIQDAINACEDGDTVRVAPGVYFQRINFNGKNITVTGIDPDNPAVVGYTVLNGERQGSVVTFANGETSQAVLTGFTITGGRGTFYPDLSDGSERLFFGAGIYLDRTSPTIVKNVIVRNEGLFEISPDGSQVDFCFGGAIGGFQCSPTIAYNVIRNNNAYIAGGIITYLGTPVIHNNIIFENSAYLGGGMITFAGDIYNNTFYANDCDGFTDIIGAPGQGGNIYLVMDPSLGQLRVFNNISVGAGSGGGVFVEGFFDPSKLRFNDVWDNFPDNYGFLDYETGGTTFGGTADQTGVNGNISQNPFFKAVLSRDYHLTLDSPCINAGDPDFVPPVGQTDIDGQERIYGSRIDIGADEYVGYVKPVAFAGWDVHVLSALDTVTLDGSGSFFYDPDGPQTYEWAQVSGLDVTLEAADTATPSFVPPAEGEYVFQLVVSDDQYTSAPDEVLVFVGANRKPVADAGRDRAWPTPGKVRLDGTASHDPDPVDRLLYIWTQLEGPEVTLADPETATPSFESLPGHKYVFELVVTDGFDDSEPSRVQIVTVNVEAQLDQRQAPPMMDLYPHHLDISGSKVVFSTDNLSNYNWTITCKDFLTNEITTFSAGGINLHPKIEGDLVVWAGGVPLASLFAPETASVFVRKLSTEQQVTLAERSSTESFSHPAVSGDIAVWLRHGDLDLTSADGWRNTPYDICGADISDLDHPKLFTIATGVGRRDPMALENLTTDYDDVIDISGSLVVWEAEGDIYAADISDQDDIKVFTVCDHAARQYDPAVSGSYIVWTDERNGTADIYGADVADPQHIKVFEIVKANGAQVQPAVEGCLVAYVDGNVGGGVIKIACITRNYGVLIPDFMGTLYGMAPAIDGTALAALGGTYGPVLTARTVFGYSVFDGPVENITTGERFDYVQHAISLAGEGGEIVLPQGRYREEINLLGKAVTVRSTDPSNPAVVAATVLEGNGTVVTCRDGEFNTTVLDGVTITGGSAGLYLSRAHPTVRRCAIAANRGPGMILLDQSKPAITHCRIVGNEGAGVDMRAEAGARIRHCEPVLSNCIVAGNGADGLRFGKPILSNCTIVENVGLGLAAAGGSVVNSIVYANGDAAQIAQGGAAVTYSAVQGGWPGQGNLDVDPQFVAAGQWIEGIWMEGDYHLRSQGFRWDVQAGQWTTDAVTSDCIDAGDPASPLQNEPTTLPSGDPAQNDRINMGAYGGTAEASLAPAGN